MNNNENNESVDTLTERVKKKLLQNSTKYLRGLKSV